ncbi:EscU/YscU/HrcU family type III secretion system export apparatus switch protein [Ferrimonas lipolytica]|uniref:Flagellar biosynthetic protein FlhB n=1 Tax=Ferrimonas lipolytica TaxID=2724191 RepID=A0A6H1UDW6_9GAMM|nr:flagellar type III secretion system protein FlhB [Ferrimonas lipolytica]QIZ76819.1 flagellar biosynthesis protein FlhB [Ferrimonas lipolytica]
MSDSSSSEKTEQPSRKKLEKANKQGQVPRSRDLTSGILLFTAPALFIVNGQSLLEQLGQFFSNNLIVTAEELRQPDVMAAHLVATIKSLITFLLQSALWLWVAAMLAAMLPKGPLFQISLLLPKFSKLNPINGLKKIVGSQSWVELGKSILKVTLFITVSVWYLLKVGPKLPMLVGLHPYQAIFSALAYVVEGIFVLAIAALLIGLIDLPYQLWKTTNDLKMTKQEVKDEHKQQEGKPEVKAKIRQLQQQMARSRASKALPHADVLVVNPEHYAVALKFDESRAEAPFVVTKGIDQVALYMRSLAPKYDLEIIEAPTLTRALYYSTRIEQQIPPALYRAVAQILSYVSQLQAARRGESNAPPPLIQPHIPAHLQTEPN